MRRKLRKIGGSLTLSIPTQVCEIYKFHIGDELGIEPMGISELRISKIEK